MDNPTKPPMQNALGLSLETLVSLGMSEGEAKRFASPVQPSFDESAAQQWAYGQLVVSRALRDKECLDAIAALQERVRSRSERAFKEQLRHHLGAVAVAALQRAFGKEKPDRSLEKLARRLKSVRRLLLKLEEPVFIFREIPPNVPPELIERLFGAGEPVVELRAYERELADSLAAWKMLYPRRAPKRLPDPETGRVVEFADCVFRMTAEHGTNERRPWNPLATLVRHVTADKTWTGRRVKSAWEYPHSKNRNAKTA